MRALPTSFRPRGRAGALLLRLIALLVVVCAPGWVWAFTPPAIEGHVTDPSRQLPADTERALEAKLAAFRTETTDEVAVFVVPSLGGETVEDVAYATFKAWRLGDAARDNGVLFVWAPAERKVRIETGRGIGDRLTDVGSSRILREVVTPQLKAGKNPEAITAGVDAILAALRRQAPPASAVPASAADEEGDSNAWIGLIIGLVILGSVVAMFVVVLVVVIKAIQRANGTGQRGGPGAGWTGTGYDASHGPSSHRTWGSSYDGGSSDGGGSSWDSGSSGGGDFSGGGGDSGGGGSSDSY